MFNLQQPIKYGYQELNGWIWGVLYTSPPMYDIMFENGKVLFNQPASKVKAV